MNDHTAETLHNQQLEGVYQDFVLFRCNFGAFNTEVFYSLPKDLRDNAAEKLSALIRKIRTMKAAGLPVPEHIIENTTAWQRAMFYGRICLLCACHGKEHSKNGTAHFCHITEQVRIVDQRNTCIWFEGVRGAG